MKKFGVFLAILFILYIIYYDVKFGTLPVAKSETIVHEEDVTNQYPTMPYQTVEVKAGDTVLSIVEALNKDKPLSSIETIIKDFETLNPKVKANLLQIGKAYHFPLYSE
ncbi:hypothetical protein ACLM5H_02195 [Fredinandcohnia humi]